MRRNIFIVFICILLIVFGGKAWAGDTPFDVNSDTEMDLRYDWTVDVKVNNTNYLGYPGSKLKPITKLQISYRINPRFEIPDAGKHIAYEELWYQGSQPIGCRRLHMLNIPATYQGTIRIVPSASTANNCGAISGAIVRLLVDLGLRGCVLTVTFIPANVFTPVADDLSRFHFYSNTNIDTGDNNLSLRLYSNPIDSVKILFYNAGI